MQWLHDSPKLFNGYRLRRDLRKVVSVEWAHKPWHEASR